MAVNTPSTTRAPRRGRAPRPPAGEPDTRAEQTRQAVLDAALEVFTEQTYGGARIEQIAERAGVAMGTIYKYFPSKHALVNEVFRYWKAKSATYTYPHSRGTTTRERLRGWVAAFARFANDYPLANEFLLSHHHAPYLDDQSRALGDPQDQLAIGNMREGQRRGEVRKGDAALLTAMIIGVFNGAARDARDRGKKLDGKTLALAEECAWDMVRAR